MAKKKKLSAEERQFVLEYLVDLNAAAAYRRVHPTVTEESAWVLGSRWLRKVNVQQAIREAQAARARRTEITGDNVLGEIARLAFANMKDVCNWGSWGVRLKASKRLPRDKTACIAEVREVGPTKNVSIKLCNKLDALEKLAKHLGLFNEEVTKAALEAVLERLLGKPGPGDVDPRANPPQG
jgi:phage terminase small subunit